MGGRFSGSTVVVTGAGRGIGAHTARAFAAEGASVVAADIDGDAARLVADTLDGALAVTVDVTSPASLADMAATAIEAFGAVDVLVNNASSCTDGSLLELTDAQIRRDVDVTLLGPLLASRAVLPGMVERRRGVILNVSSVNGLSYFGCEAYSAAKAGVNSLTHSLAIQFGSSGVRCNAVAPGSIATQAWDHRLDVDPLVLEKAAQWYPLGRVGTVADVADALLFLASDEASWITGVVLPVDGGILTGNLAMARAIIPSSNERTP